MNKKMNNILKYNNNEHILAKGVTVPNNTFNSTNANICLIGGTGSGKTTGYCHPNLAHPSGSLIVTDTKGNLHRKFGPSLEKMGYNVLFLDFVNPTNPISKGYNPLDYIRRDSEGQIIEKDIMKIAKILIPSDHNKDNEWWTQSACRYVSLLIGFVMEFLPKKDQNISSVLTMHRRFIAGKGDNLLEKCAEKYPQGYVARRYERYENLKSADRTMSCILEFASAGLDPFDTKEWGKLFSNPDTVDFHEIGRKKTVLFINTSDRDSSYDVLTTILQSQLLQTLLDDADANADSRLKVGVRLICDDFAASAKIPDFERIVSIIRSRNISVSIILQSQSQLTSMYGENGAKTIINNMGNILYLGSNDLDTAKWIGSLTGQMVTNVFKLPMNKCFVITLGNIYSNGKNYVIADKIRYDDPCAQPVIEDTPEI